MALNQRRVKILDLIREDGHAKVQELSRIFNVTDVTIRQDLEALEKLGPHTYVCVGVYIRMYRFMPAYV